MPFSGTQVKSSQNEAVHAGGISGADDDRMVVDRICGSGDCGTACGGLGMEEVHSLADAQISAEYLRKRPSVLGSVVSRRNNR